MATPFPKLKIMAGPEEGQEFSLVGWQAVRIGRSDASDFVLNDTSVSRHHCRITGKEEGFFIKDDGSRNGTFIEDEKIPNTAEIKLHHLDLVRIGIYEIRFLEKEFAEKDLQGKPAAAQASAVLNEPPAQQTSEATIRQETTPVLGAQKQVAADDQSAPILSQAKTPHEDDEPDDLDSHEISLVDRYEPVAVSSVSKRLSWIFTGIAAACALAALSYFFYQQHRGGKKPASVAVEIFDAEVTDDKPVKAAKIAKETKASEPSPARPPQVIPAETRKDQPANPVFQVFLDVKSQPLPATVYFQDKRLGITPLKQSVSVKPGATYEIFADFELRDLADIYRKKVSFKPRLETDVVDLSVTAEIGTLKIQRLPRKVAFYLEGYYAYDNLKSNPVKITDIVYGRPIYLPYGKYAVELREKTKMAGSDNEITQVRFQREYVIDEKNRVLELNVTDKDLQFFPAVIRSNPSNAVIHAGDDKIGTTPFQGVLPVGANKLTISKDGYFDTAITVDMRMNSVYETTVTLNTSKMGEMINAAKDQIRHEQVNQAVNTLIDALKFGGSSKEKAEVYYMLGGIFLSQAGFDQARPYFEKAALEKAFEQKAKLGLAQAYHGLKDDVTALSLLVEVMANFDDDTPADVRSDAHAIFKRISPLKSVIYIYTDPAGAGVYVNDKKLDQVSPLILSELGLGHYRLEFDKPGYQSFKTTQNLKIGEFVTVKVQLKPEQL